MHSLIPRGQIGPLRPNIATDALGKAGRVGRVLAGIVSDELPAFELRASQLSSCAIPIVRRPDNDAVGGPQSGRAADNANFFAQSLSGLLSARVHGNILQE